MLTPNLDDATSSNFGRLVEANFAHRDELYVAAESLDDEDNREICRELAEHLAHHAIFLQQLLANRGLDVPEPPDMEPTAWQQLRNARNEGGENAVLAVAERNQQLLKRDYDEVIGTTPDAEAIGMLQRQRREVEFGERILRCLRSAKPR